MSILLRSIISKQYRYCVSNVYLLFASIEADYQPLVRLFGQKPTFGQQWGLALLEFLNICKKLIMMY